MRLVLLTTGLILFGLAGPLPSHACTVFSFTTKGDRFLAKNYESETRGNLTVKHNPANAIQTRDKTSWTSKYDSLTIAINDDVIGGINSAGLMMEILECPPYSFSKGANSLDWIKFHLDQFSNVQSVIHSLEALGNKLDPQDSGRFMGCDPIECFFVEISSGKLQYSRRDDFTSDVMADLLKDKKEGDATTVRVPAADLNLDLALAKLEKDQNAKTQWSIVYEVNRRGFTFKTKDMGVARSYSLVALPKALTVQQLYPLK